MEFNPKKFFIFLAVLAGAWYYVHTHYSPQDLLDYAHNHPGFALGPTVDYYVAMGYFTRSDYDKSNQAFQQLLTDYATTQYTPDALLRLGDAYEETFKWGAARDAYQQYMDRFPDGKEIQVVKGKFDQIKFK